MAVVQTQILNKVLNTKDYSLIADNGLNDSMFGDFKDEFNFIKSHYEQYGNVPDKSTFLEKFPIFVFEEVNEKDSALINAIREYIKYGKLADIMNKAAEICKLDSNEASAYLKQELAKLDEDDYKLGGTDIIAQAQQRYDEYLNRKNNQEASFFTSGFEELDDITHGIQRGEELLVLFARTNQGKSWIVEKMCTHVWQLGFNVGYISPEMTANSIGYRFDTLYNNFSNKALMWGNGDVQEKEYQEYINGLSSMQHKFIVATPQDFSKKITVTKIKNWIKQYKLDMIAIDGITYMTDERYRRGDNKTTSLTNISEDLMSLSVELQIPILIVVQANREGVKENDGAPELENIRDSDGISHNASKVISIKQLKDSNVVELNVKKQRFGPVNKSLKYHWDIDLGKFTFMPTFDDAQPAVKTRASVDNLKKTYKDVTDVF